jgi:D-beta-D-heptose 7-phosphate kinase/D-beta-D-heptose 1-phosphate adenosyltransferase
MKKILVIGESCRDIFVYCDANRLCPDMPVPVLSVLRQTENEGMAMNVQRNIRSLVSDCDIYTNTNWHSITKTRYIHEHTNHMFIRIDTDHNVQRADLSNLDLNYELVVISDYNKGFLSEEDIELICSRHNNVFIDTKKILGKWIKNAKYIKINNFEYENSKANITSTIREKLIHTKGGDGCIFQDNVYPVNRVEVKDSSGAGDSFMSGLVCKYLETSNIVEAITFANKCAAEVVQHRGVTII